jgi:membrane-associated phospholipid phosphatase
VNWLNFDVTWFKKINHDWTNPVFDAVLPLVRESVIWVPLYVFLIAFAWQNFREQWYMWMLFAIATALLTNFISSDIIKELTNKPRPCRTPGLEPAARVLVNYCPISSSFTSSHATNHFGLAMFLYMTLRPVVKWGWLFFLWAFMIIYAQVYVGVHYPGDVIFGALLGCLIGYMTSALFHWQWDELKISPRPAGKTS